MYIYIYIYVYTCIHICEIYIISIIYIVIVGCFVLTIGSESKRATSESFIQSNIICLNLFLARLM